MPVFNTARFLEQALRSVGAQSFRDFELLVIDDGSTDGSIDILRAFATTESRLRLISRENKGLIATRNELLGAAAGKYLAWMDSDDVSLPDRLKRQYELLRDRPELVCIGSFARCIDPEGSFLKLEEYPADHAGILQAQQQGGAMRFPTTMMRRDAATRVGGFREPFRMGEDFDLLLRLSEVGKMANIQDTLYLYRQHIESVCATLGQQWITYRDAILELSRERAAGGQDKLQRGEALRIEPRTLSRNGRQVSNVYFEWAAQGYENGNNKLALKYLWKGLHANPTSVVTYRAALRILKRMAELQFSWR
jgi:glycosyltransferase involved in cell wall biosynthesis